MAKVPESPMGSASAHRRGNPSAPLTVAEVNALKPPPSGRVVVRDPACRGLTLRVSAHGRKTWSLETKVDGQFRRFTLGELSAMSLAEARRAADALRGTAQQGGRDPVAEKRERRRQERLRRAGAADAATVRTLLDSFEKLKAGPAQLRSWGEMRCRIEHNFKGLLDRDPAALRRSDIIAVLDAGVARSAPISGKRAVRGSASTT